MSQFVQLKSAYRISELDIDRIATKVHHRKKKLIVKIYYKPNRRTHTDLLFQTPELLLKNNVKYNKKGYYELEAPFLGKKQKSIKQYEDFISTLEEKVISIIKKNKDWFTDNNIQFKSVIRFPNNKDEIYKLLRLKIDSDTIVKHNGNNIDINTLSKDYYVKCILKVSYIFIKGSFVTINVYPVLIDLRDKLEVLQFASSESSLSSELTTESATESEEEVKPKLEVQTEIKDEEEVLRETLEEHNTTVLEIPTELRDNCGTVDMFNEEPQELVDNKTSEEEQQELEDNKTSEEEQQELEDNKTSEEEIDYISNNELDLSSIKNDTDTSVISNFNSEKFLETYGGPNIRNIELSEESKDSDYSEEINSDEIANYEESLI